MPNQERKEDGINFYQLQEISFGDKFNENTGGSFDKT